MILKAKIAKGGKVSIPSACRKHLNIKDGEEIIFSIKDDEVVISPLKFTLEKVRKLINRHHPTKESLVEKLISERRKEAENE
jgi:AbrB family looped-hinge helix DNA binding protein